MAGAAGLRSMMVAVLAGTTMLTGIATAMAQATAPQQAQANSARQTLAIAPQPLDDALTAFSNATRIQVLVSGDLTRGVASPGARGIYSAEQALVALLAGTGLTYRYVDAVTVTLVPAPARAPSAAPAAAASGAAALALAPVTVFGAKTTTTLEDVTSSVGIVSQQDIERREIRDIRSSFRTMANVQDSDFNDAGFVIRGLNSEGLTPGGAPLASFYIDGVQQTVMGARRGARGLFDAQQVEVYRGPQSTLAGRAALAGAVYVKTKDPTYEYEAEAEGLVGNMDTRGGALMVNAPLVDNQAALRLTAEYQRSESEINYPTYSNFANYEDIFTDEYFTIRGKFLLEPDKFDDTRALVTYSYSEDAPALRDIAGPGLGFAFDEKRGDFNTPNFAEIRRGFVHNAGLEVTHDFSDSLMLTSHTGFTRSQTDRPSVNAGTPGETDITLGRFVQSLITQEFRLNYYGDRLDAVFGLYGSYQDDDNNYLRPNYFGASSDISQSTQETRNLAMFGEATYEFVPSWKFVLGGRVDYTDQDGTQFFSRNGVASTDFNYTVRETVLLPKIGIIKELGPDHSVGFTIQEGFRAGGAGLQRSTGQVYTFDPEYAWNYELSYKGRYLNNRLNVAANLFYVDYKDQQVETLATPGDFSSSSVVNAASSRAYGFEVEAQASLTRELTGFLSVGYVDTEFEDFDSASAGNLSGLPFPEAPEWSVALGALYEHRSGFFIGADAKYTDDFMARLGSAPQDTLSSYVTANAQVGYRYENWTATLFAENIFDKEYFLYNDNDIAATVGMPRFVGVKLNMKF
ncbi:hypothetical protein AUP43_03150 [Oceanibaculum pacificum]|uniref:Secretin/TonB short N-terminal domain-containing protein n=2 Tax=Oceanibaculum pacificum TaxID=580166 RepID=A0A154VS59_9PROT|nr:hypothetical protein AUP43_03150 [Oceanibaculum pacificum]